MDCIQADHRHRISCFLIMRYNEKLLHPSKNAAVYLHTKYLHSSQLHFDSQYVTACRLGFLLTYGYGCLPEPSTAR